MIIRIGGKPHDSPEWIHVEWRRCGHLPLWNYEPAADDLMTAQPATAKETAWVLMVDEQLSPLPLMTFSGEPSEIALPLRQIVSAALKSDCRFLLLGHSHGDGDPGPSADDIRTTRLLCRMLTPLRITLADHIIYAGNTRFSFREQALL